MSIENLPKKLGNFPEASQELYLPFVSAVNDPAIIDPENIELQSLPDIIPPLRQGRMPRHGGVFYDPRTEGLGAVDFMALRVVGDKVCFLPTPKSAVDDQTMQVQAEGVSIITMPDGLISVAMLAESARHSFERVNPLKFILPGIETVKLEILDIEDSGIIYAQQYQPKLMISMPAISKSPELNS